VAYEHAFIIFFLSILVIALAVHFEESTLRSGDWESWAGYPQRLLHMVPLTGLIVVLLVLFTVAAVFLAERVLVLAALGVIVSGAVLWAIAFVVNMLLDAFGAEAWLMIFGSAVLGTVFRVATVCLIDRDTCRD